MYPYFKSIPASINCKKSELEKIKKLLGVIPKALLTDEVIAAIKAGEPIRLFTQPTSKMFRLAQDPQIQKCFEGNILHYITTDAYAESLDSRENHRRWNKRYENRCSINGKPCSLRNSCDKCPHKDQKQPFFTPLEEHLKKQLNKESGGKSPRGRHRPFNQSNPTFDAVEQIMKHEALIELLHKEDELYVKEYDLREQGYKNKQIAVMLKLSESTVCRNLKAIDDLEDEFEADWERDKDYSTKA